MKKKVSVFIVLLLIMIKPSIAQETFDTYGLNNVIYDSTLEKDILIGNCDVQGIKESTLFKRSFKAEKKYEPNTSMFIPGDEALNSMDITIVMGSWCPDSQREVPRMIKILEAIDYPMDKLRIIAVNRKKEVPYFDISSLDVHYVPTFIFYKEGVEKGRIVEMPKQSLEIDMVNIINN